MTVEAKLLKIMARRVNHVVRVRYNDKSEYEIFRANADDALRTYTKYINLIGQRDGCGSAVVSTVSIGDK